MSDLSADLFLRFSIILIHLMLRPANLTGMVIMLLVKRRRKYKNSEETDANTGRTVKISREEWDNGTTVGILV